MVSVKYKVFIQELFIRKLRLAISLSFTSDAVLFSFDAIKNYGLDIIKPRASLFHQIKIWMNLKWFIR